MEKRRIMLTIAYDGTEYCGWQVQPNGNTVEEAVNRAVSEATGEDIRVIGASRTDSGVHALGNVAVFDTCCTIPAGRMAVAVNHQLPRDIVVQEAREVPADFHPRYTEARKTYTYAIWRDPVPNPLRRRYTTYYYYPLDVEKMKTAAGYLEGEHDFASFCSSKSDVENTVRTIESITFEEKGKELILTFTGNGFLYNMIRMIAGVLMRVGGGYYPPEEVLNILEKRERGYARPTAPPQGLTLVKIEYPELKDTDAVFRYFEEICGIPHGSGHTEAISSWLVSTAEKLGLPCVQDDMGNVVIRKAASEGYEDVPSVILQGHMDMVCEKTAGCNKDMESEGPEIMTDGVYIRAKDTTLGADDGIALAMTLAVLADDTLEHPAIEAVFTVDEEIGMLGAAAFDKSTLRSKYMLNLDSEDEGRFCVSCAGGNRTRAFLPVRREKAPEGTMFGRLAVRGLTGGHSGIDIRKGGANADKVLAEILKKLSDAADLRIVSVSGGKKDNVIPTEAEAVLAVVQGTDADVLRSLKEIMEAAGQQFKEQYSGADPDMEIVLETVAGAGSAAESAVTDLMDQESTDNVIEALNAFPNGVQALTPGREDLVQTSLNLGILETDEETVQASFCVRSSVDAERDDLSRQILEIAERYGGRTEIAGAYCGWAYKEESPLRDLLADVYRKQTGKEPVIEAIHAGVECGFFAGAIPGLDCVSLGPDMDDVHTPREKLSIDSTKRIYALLVEALKEMKR